MNRPVPQLELMLFETSSVGAREAVRHGVAAFLVDWEQAGKYERQQNFDTEVNGHGVEELRAVSGVAGTSVWCRINGAGCPCEIEAALEAGARGIFLPMVRCAADVERVVRVVDGRSEIGILVETVEGLRCVRDLAVLPLNRVYFGLNDFAISRGGGNIFRAVLDGSVERAREAFADIPFGFGGITAVDAGSPLPCARLIEEMARLRCAFSFLRRSFRRDVARLGQDVLIRGVQAYWNRCLDRTPGEVAADRLVLDAELRRICHVS